MREMSIITTTKQNVKNLVPKTQLQTATQNAIYLVLGIFISKGVAFGVYAPFGTAFLAAVPYKNMFFTLLGTVMGYVLPSEINIGIRYISTALAVCAIRWTLTDLPKINKSRFFAPSIAFATTIATGLAINVSNMSDFNKVAMYITEATLSAFAAYFFGESIKIFSQKRTRIKQAELVYLCATAFIVILSLLTVTLGDISIGKILAVLVVIFCAKYLGVVGGSISGITAGVIFGLASKEPTYIMGAYAFGGLIAGLMSSFGRFVCCLAFLVANMIISAQTGNPLLIISGIYEIIVASLIFIFLRDDIGERFIGLFSAPVNYERHEGLKDTIAMRLDFASKALTNISESINMVSEKLSNIGKNRNVCLAAIDKVCKNCGLKTFCFDEKNTDTTASFSQINEVLRHNGEINKNNFPEDLSKRCGRVAELTNNINTLYKENCEKLASESRISQVRDFVSEQFADIGLLLEDIVAEVKNYDSFDLELAQKITTELKRLNITPIDVCCRYDKFGRLSVEIESENIEESSLEKLNLARKLSKICGRKLDEPCVISNSDVCRLQFAEKAIFDVQTGVAQHICKNGAFCGDNYTFFNDGMGRMIFILSDGMGTGGRAAVEGAMACRLMENLIKSGINFATAAKITNSALRVKSEDEFLATLDIFCMDLFSGDVNLLKAGAPLTFLKKNDKVVRVAQASLPIGILKEVNLSEYTDILTTDDKILIVSDGAVSHSDEWLEIELKNWTDEDAQNFANSIIEKILADKTEDFDDDITVIAMKVVESAT